MYFCAGSAVGFLYLKYQMYIIDKCINKLKAIIYVHITVRPQIFITRTARHGGARRFGAVLGYSAINKIYAIEKVHDYNE